MPTAGIAAANGHEEFSARLAAHEEPNPGFGETALASPYAQRLHWLAGRARGGARFPVKKGAQNLYALCWHAHLGCANGWNGKSLLPCRHLFAKNGVLNGFA